MSALLARLYRVERGRNAWQYSWSWRTWGEPCLNRRDACRLAEEGRDTYRQRGLHWSIAEMPACAVADGVRALVLAEPKSKTPLSNIQLPDAAEMSLEDLRVAIQGINAGGARYWVSLVALSSVDVDVRGGMDYCWWSSTTQGGNQLLGWKRSRRE